MILPVAQGRGGREGAVMNLQPVPFYLVEKNSRLSSGGLQVGGRGSTTNHDVAVTPVGDPPNVRWIELLLRLHRQGNGCKKKPRNCTKTRQWVHQSSRGKKKSANVTNVPGLKEVDEIIDRPSLLCEVSTMGLIPGSRRRKSAGSVPA